MRRETNERELFSREEPAEEVFALAPDDSGLDVLAVGAVEKQAIAFHADADAIADDQSCAGIAA